LAEVVRSAQAAGAQATVFSLTDHKVIPCLACDACHKTGVCPQKDDFNTLKSAMLGADGIVLASPNYITSVSAQMKAVFDRCCGPLHCQAMRDKYAAAIETSGGTGGEEVQQYMLRFLRSMGCWTVGSVGAMGTDPADPVRRQAVFAMGAELGKSLVAAVEAKQTYPDQIPERQAFFERMKKLVRFRGEAWPYEYKHWKSQGWL
jgi:multimeric flavodoxin WrbA